MKRELRVGDGKREMDREDMKEQLETYPKFFSTYPIYLTNKIDPGPMETENAYDKPMEDLPLRWWQALARFSDSKILPPYLGAHYCETYAAARAFENDAFQAKIPALDYAWYMRSV